MLHLSSSWTKSTPSAPRGWRGVLGGTVKCSAQCWSCSTSWMALRPPRTSRLSWLLIGLISWTRRCFAQGVLTEKLNSHPPTRRPGWTF
uniref:Proteasome 26S subunit, ATPase 5 n=1 Tax=Macaca fascicularis TaxID=9541 RepID=A0A7N9I9A8_MACFA